jgi:hypothetical protein
MFLDLRIALVSFYLPCLLAPMSRSVRQILLFYVSQLSKQSVIGTKSLQPIPTRVPQARGGMNVQ